MKAKSLNVTNCVVNCWYCFASTDFRMLWAYGPETFQSNLGLALEMMPCIRSYGVRSNQNGDQKQQEARNHHLSYELNCVMGKNVLSKFNVVQSGILSRQTHIYPSPRSVVQIIIQTVKSTTYSLTRLYPFIISGHLAYFIAFLAVEVWVFPANPNGNSQRSIRWHQKCRWADPFPTRGKILQTALIHFKSLTIRNSRSGARDIYYEASRHQLII